eukprot:6189366-Pleurochrysis_carterae.AAC.3
MSRSCGNSAKSKRAANGGAKGSAKAQAHEPAHAQDTRLLSAPIIHLHQPAQKRACPHASQWARTHKEMRVPSGPTTASTAISSREPSMHGNRGAGLPGRRIFFTFSDRTVASGSGGGGVCPERRAGRISASDALLTRIHRMAEKR